MFCLSSQNVRRLARWTAACNELEKGNSRKKSGESPGNHPSQNHLALKWKVQFPMILATLMTEHAANLSKIINTKRPCLFKWLRPTESGKSQIEKEQNPGGLSFQLTPLLINICEDPATLKRSECYDLVLATCSKDCSISLQNQQSMKVRELKEPERMTGRVNLFWLVGGKIWHC